MRRLSVIDTPMAGLKLVERLQLGDNRGYLTRLFCADELRDAGWSQPVVQINLSYTSRRGVLRGLHFQRPPHAEDKLVSCIRGAVWDVAVDLRRGSPTFLHWHAAELSADNRVALLLPKGFAHGFQTLTEDAELVYMHSHAYVSESESGLHPLEPRLAIAWPLPVAEMSARDAAHAPLPSDFEGLTP